MGSNSGALFSGITMKEGSQVAAVAAEMFCEFNCVASGVAAESFGEFNCVTSARLAFEYITTWPIKYI